MNNTRMLPWRKSVVFGPMFTPDLRNVVTVYTNSTSFTVHATYRQKREKFRHGSEFNQSHIRRIATFTPYSIPDSFPKSTYPIRNVSWAKQQLSVAIIPLKIAFLKGTDRCFFHLATESCPVSSVNVAEVLKYFCPSKYEISLSIRPLCFHSPGLIGNRAWYSG
jgi:hypothetical protein